MVRNGPPELENEMHLPLVPLHVLLVRKSSEVGSERTTRERKSELASLVDGVALRLDDEVGKRICCQLEGTDKGPGVAAASSHGVSCVPSVAFRDGASTKQKHTHRQGSGCP